MSAAISSAQKGKNKHNYYQRSRSMFSMYRRNDKGFTLVEVIVVAVIVAVLALVGVQLYQGYVVESRKNTAENLAASAASFLQTVVNSRDVGTAEALGDLTGPATWTVNLGTATGTNIVSFTCPANASITMNTTAGTVTATIGTTPSEGTYYYKTP
jgi:prepilin-type N-terminal cleavage/methylation domain-containing protein